MEIQNYITTDNIALLFSGIALIVSGFSFRISKKELILNKLHLKTAFHLGLSKLKELIELADKIQNITPTNITKANFDSDKLIINQLLEKYSLNEEIISKTSYAIPNQIFEIKKTLNKLQLNFDGISDKEIYGAEIEILINYSHLFFMFSLLCSPFSISEKNLINKEEEKLYLKFNKMYLQFFQHKSELMNSKFENALNELKNN